MKNINDLQKLKTYINKYNLNFLNEVIDDINIKTYNNNEIIMMKNEKFTSISIIVEGIVKVVPMSIDGKEMLIGYLNPNEIYGDIEYYCEVNSIHLIACIKRCMIIEIPYTIINQQLKNNNDYLMFMNKRLAKKLYKASLSYSNKLLSDAKSLLINFIFNSYENTSENIIKISSYQLAQIIGVSDRHIRRLLNQLCDEGIIIKHNKYIEIIDIKSLKEKSAL